MLETRLEGLAIWDGTEFGGVGGTGSVVDLWRSRGVPVQRVAPQAGPAGTAGETAVQTVAAPEPSRAGGFEYTIKTMLFADAVGYSRLNDEQIPLFFEHYMGVIAGLNARTPYRAEHVETAGDGMYMVFGDPGAAGHYALALIDLVNGQDWQSLGLPADMATRVGLHCGPVFVGIDPITGRPLYSGSHTSRTARIEPITPPGQVYVSSAFAAVATALGVEGLRFSYVGRTQLAKQYGKLALYHVQRP
jgi:adenylate cyclase